MRFAAFIVTYQRPIVLKETIGLIVAQTMPPQKILIIDNDPEQSARSVAQECGCSYEPMGFNAGPSGAAKKGLQQLAQEGYEWILWGDDNDPPRYPDTFEQLFEIPSLYKGEERIGQIGMVGQTFSAATGTLRRFSDEELSSSILHRVDTIAGGQGKIVHASVVLDQILPDPDLFFGFEELAFDLKLKKAGYLSFVRGDYFMRLRKKYDRLNFKKPSLRKINTQALWRTYYSTRNLLFILWKQQLYLAWLLTLLRLLLRIPFAYRYGIRYGNRNARFTVLGMGDWIRGRYGWRQDLQ